MIEQINFELSLLVNIFFTLPQFFVSLWCCYTSFRKARLRILFFLYKHSVFKVTSTILSILLILALFYAYEIVFLFSVWVFFHEHSRFKGQQGKGEAISLTLLCHFRPLHRHLDISRVITAETTTLDIASSWTRTGNLCFRSASH